MDKFDSSEITKEIGLFDIYKASRSRLSINKINIFSTLSVFSMLVTYVFASQEDSISLLNKAREWAELGFSFAVGILGFLIAGFTIFASVSDKSLFVAMAKTNHTKSGLSYLKYNFFTLMYVFIAYLGFAALCLLMQLLGGTSGFFSTVLRFFFDGNTFLIMKRILASTTVVIVGTWFFYLIMLLQSFIFNIYHIVMTAIRWEVEESDRKSQENKNR